VFWFADDKRFRTEEEMGVGVAEPVVMSDKAEFSEKNTNS
jgi:hypothetical protein